MQWQRRETDIQKRWPTFESDFMSCHRRLHCATSSSRRVVCHSELFRSPLNFGGCGMLCPCRTSRRRRHRWLFLGNASRLICSVVPSFQTVLFRFCTYSVSLQWSVLLTSSSCSVFDRRHFFTLDACCVMATWPHCAFAGCLKRGCCDSRQCWLSYRVARYWALMIRRCLMQSMKICTGCFSLLVCILFWP